MPEDVIEWVQQVVELRRALRDQPPSEGEWQEYAGEEAGGDID